MRPELAILRPLHWSKNSLVLAPLVFDGPVSPSAIGSAVLAAAGFCLVASATYVVNDLADLERDRIDPRTHARPLARGDLSRGRALRTASACLVGGLALAGVAGALASTAAYATLSLGYSVRLKAVPVLDVLAVAVGFALRVAGGAEALSVSPSPWMLAASVSGALGIVLLKRLAQRRSGRTDAGSSTLGERTLGLGAGLSFLVAAAVLTSWAARRGGTAWLPTLCALLGLGRYVTLGYRSGASPERILLRDPWLLAAVTGFVVLGAWVLRG